MCMEGWTTPREVVTFVECRGCDYKGTKMKENQGQGFLSKGQLCNMWCGSCKEVWNWREKEAKGGRAERVKCGWEERWKEIRKEKYSVCHAGQEKKCHGGTGVES